MDKLKEFLSYDDWEWYLTYKDLALYKIYVLMCQRALQKILEYLDYDLEVLYRTYVDYHDLEDYQKEEFDEFFDMGSYGDCLELIEGGEYNPSQAILDNEPKDEHFHSYQPDEGYYPSYALRNFKRWLDYDELERRFLAKFGE